MNDQCLYACVNIRHLVGVVELPSCSKRKCENEKILDLLRFFALIKDLESLSLYGVPHTTSKSLYRILSLRIDLRLDMTVQ